MTTTDTNPQVKEEGPEPPDPYRTVWTMFKSPGVVSSSIINGDERTYVKPSGVFLFFWAAFFLLAPGKSITPDLYGQMNNMPYSFLAKQVVEKKIKEQKTNLKAFEKAYYDAADMAARAMIGIIVLLFAIFLRIINRKLSGGIHVTVAYEFVSSLMICWLVILGWLPESISTWLLIIVILGLLYGFQRNAYKQAVSKSITNAGLLVVCFFGIAVIYRAIIFFFTVWKS